ncbi:hypothetical protein L5F32_01470 [Aliarcobacter butzleri]|uniref:hypothetical protein n=1 Tax=Aliarcobacter butzleri TaxID=28197 RepID=UPI00062E51E6|nr:hypothetical protein [Aliarcobacter butzleri]KLD96034.1 hypothetical protein AF74_11425 [Aliarcobacter butzleri L349]MCG3650930.1 hypothetical protein [Aliarcobacter butzleri]
MFKKSIKVYFISFSASLAPITIYNIISIYIFGNHDPKMGYFGTLFLLLMINSISSFISSVTISFAYLFITKRNIFTKKNLKLLIISSILVGLISNLNIYLAGAFGISYFLIWPIFAYIFSYYIFYMNDLGKEIN